MKPITVFRIEYPTGLGVWTAIKDNKHSIIDDHSKFHEIASKHRNVTKFPTLYRDDELYDKYTEMFRKEVNVDDYKFAYNSITKLKQAFTPPQIRELIKLGFDVYEVTTSDYIKSRFQTMFNPDNCIKVNINNKFK